MRRLRESFTRESLNKSAQSGRWSRHLACLGTRGLGGEPFVAILWTSIAIGLLSTSAAMAEPAAWHPKPAAKDAAVEQSRVRIVDFGTDFLRDGDGRPVHQFGVHHYALSKDPATGIWTPLKDFELDLSYDVDGDGRTDDDVVGYHEFSLTRPFSPQAAWYDSLAGTPRWYGAAAIFQANRRETSFSESGVNHEHDGPAYHPRDNWALFHETYEIYSPYRLYGLWLWQKHDFLNGGGDYRVSFDNKSEIALYLQRYFMGVEGVRFVLRDGEQFYLSEAVFKGAGQVRGSGDGKQHILCPKDTRWAKYNPKAPYHVDFEAKNARFVQHEFNDVTAVGFYMYKDRLIPSYIGFKWYAFEANAVVHRRDRPGENIDMVNVAAADGVPAFYISTCELPYLLWKNVYRLARSNTFVRDPRGFHFDKDGDMGSMDFPGDNGKLLWHSPDEPVTDFTLHDAAAWCNALSVQESRTPCYYEDPQFETVFHFVKRSPLYGEQRQPPRLYVNWGADGYRLPSPDEWQAALAGEKTSAGTACIGENSKGQTQPVGWKKANALGLYDMLGNVWELVWTFGDAYDPGRAEPIMVLGGDFNYPTDPRRLSANPSGDKPYEGSYNIGLRLVRREGGLAAPKQVQIASDIPQWTIQKEAKTRATGASHALGKPVLEMIKVPGNGFEIARYETTFARWKEVYDWAVANGYSFDHDGDMGSMDYWGFNGWGAPRPHSPDEPVTDITGYDAQVWCNALSEMEGKTPVYYEDRECKRVYRKAFRFRPLMKLFFEASEVVRSGPYQTVFANTDADGYRLPTSGELADATRGGGGGGTGGPAQADAVSAWLYDTSGGTTHPVGRSLPNSLGLYDMEGNVSEITHNQRKGRAFTMYRMGGSFLDLTVGLGKGRQGEPPWSPKGWGYTDIGFRVIRQTPARTVSRLTAPAAPFLPMRAIMSAALTSTGKAVLDIDQSAYDPLRGKVYCGSLLRDGVFEASGVPALKGLKWKFQTNGPIKSSPVVVDGIVHFGSNDGYIYALDAETGRELWKVKTGDKVTGSAAIVGGVVYTAGEDGVMYALDAKSGAERWTTKFSRSRPASSPAVAYGVVFIATGNSGGSEQVRMSSGPTVGLDARTGKQIWQCSLGSQGYGSPAVVGGTLCQSNSAVDLRTGSVLWRISTSGQSRVFVTLAISGGMAYGIGSIGGDVVVAEIQKGRPVWSQFTLEGQVSVRNMGKSGYEVFTGPAVAHDRVYVGCNDGKLHTFDAATGKRGWTFQTAGKVQSSPSVAGEVVYFGSWDGYLYAVHAKSGKLSWKFKPSDQPAGLVGQGADEGGRIISSPWPSDGVVYVGCDDGCLYAIY